MSTKGKTKKPKYVGDIRGIVAANVARLQLARYSGVPNMDKTLAEKLKVSLSTVQRVLSEEVGTSVDTIELIAHHFGVEPWMLLVDNFNPQRIPRLAYDTAPAPVRDRVAR